MPKETIATPVPATPALESIGVYSVDVSVGLPEGSTIEDATHLNVSLYKDGKTVNPQDVPGFRLFHPFFDEKGKASHLAAGVWAEAKVALARVTE